MDFKRRHRSDVIKPLHVFVDLLIVNLLIFWFPLQYKSHALFAIYVSFAWIVIALRIGFYQISRFSKFTRVIMVLTFQYALLFVCLYAYIGLFKEPNISRLALGYYFLASLMVVSGVKIFAFYFLKTYRSNSRGNFRRIVVYGDSKQTKLFTDLIRNRLDFGLSLVKGINLKKESVLDSFSYLQENNIDQVYCSVNSLSNDELASIIQFTENNLIDLKLIPDNKSVFSKKMTYEYYDFIPVLSLREIPLNGAVNKMLKRAFDLVFSSIVILFIMSWLYPIVGLIILLESRGSIMFNQPRSGLDNKPFNCHKFRSMKPNKEANMQQAVKNDMRITKVGAFIRKTSIDELPQFINVFLGQMSVVGPRPHMLSHTNKFAKVVDKFMLRHSVKPGITGLAQIKGYRGEIETNTDITHRVKYDIFYIENWSIFLDIKIILQTVINAIRGEKKAY